MRLNNLLSVILTFWGIVISHRHVELQSPNRQAFRRKALLICWQLRACKDRKSLASRAMWRNGALRQRQPATDYPRCWHAGTIGCRESIVGILRETLPVTSLLFARAVHVSEKDNVNSIRLDLITSLFQVLVLSDVYLVEMRCDWEREMPVLCTIHCFDKIQ